MGNVGSLADQKEREGELINDVVNEVRKRGHDRR